MDVRIAPVATAIAQGAGSSTPSAPGQAGSAGFSDALRNALQSVSDLQQQSSSLQARFQLGAGEVSLEQTMVAMQRSQVAFQAAVTVRNRLVSAYTDIMNMPV